MIFFYWFFVWRHREYTDDAYVEGNQVYITPLHPGFVKAIHTDDTFLVKEGQLVVELDETDAKIAFDTATEALANTVRSVCQMVHSVFAYKAEIEMKKAEFIRSAQDYEHRENVIDAGGVSLEDFEHAIAGLRSSYFSLQMTEILYDKALAMVQNTSLKSHPLVLAAADKVRDAWVRLYTQALDVLPLFDHFSIPKELIVDKRGRSFLVRALAHPDDRVARAATHALQRLIVLHLELRVPVFKSMLELMGRVPEQDVAVRATMLAHFVRLLGIP
jgi:hypothetical protein